MAGAGVSAGKPSALPGWKPLNASIIRVLSRRLESALDRTDWLTGAVSLVDAARTADRFPPEYQAQLIEEMCGERYFHGLQSLDIDAINSGHEGIAALAVAGCIKAVVTTNFDRLIEYAFDRHGVKYMLAYDEGGFVRMTEHLRTQATGPIPIVKIHGCVSSPLSMIDTLKQRRLGRSQQVEACLAELSSAYWLYLGFSAADLEGNSEYLGLRKGAAHSPGATYVAYPARPELGKGARSLMSAFGDRGEVIPADIGELLRSVCQTLGVKEPSSIVADRALGAAIFEEKLTAWANGLSPAAAGLCLAAVLEAIGEAEIAVRILDRLVRKELLDERDTPDFRALQLHYGRLGAVWGRFIAVPDLNGAASNASVETVQSLPRMKDSELGFAALSWAACSLLWLNQGETAMGIAVPVMNGFWEGKWDGLSPRNKEEAVDAWLSGAQVFFVNTHHSTYKFIASRTATVLEMAKNAGDVVRTARVAALYLLVLAETKEDVPKVSEEFKSDFDEAARVGDGFALGMRELALGRWHVGVGGLALARETEPFAVAQRALEHLKEAVVLFQKQGMDPWEVFAFLQQAKAYADLRQFDNVQACIDFVKKGLVRFPVFASHFYETVASLQRITGDSRADETSRAAIEAAKESGLMARYEMLSQRMPSASPIPQAE